ncbi:hypothetical protein B0H17DRAFT_1212553 [Mycena rosella]|uniref:Uncharacterized protein n=1 Tax=Mycena rosella TaxID=1033263 RepID=A0AAD7CRH4_MYCRO|nr:hypothetical protein B0H17DRAFT_1212553 [Mycena rosella]
MSTEFKDLESDALKSGKMGPELHRLVQDDVLLVIQWRSMCDLYTLWQRLGRAARQLQLVAMGLFLVEPKRFDLNIAKAQEWAVKRAEAAEMGSDSSVKRAAITAQGAPNTPVPLTITVSTPTPVAGDNLAPEFDIQDLPIPFDIPATHDYLRVICFASHSTTPTYSIPRSPEGSACAGASGWPCTKACAMPGKTSMRRAGTALSGVEEDTIKEEWAERTVFPQYLTIQQHEHSDMLITAHEENILETKQTASIGKKPVKAPGSAAQAGKQNTGGPWGGNN